MIVNMIGYMQQIVFYKSGTQTTSISRLINVSQLQYLRANLADLKQVKLYNESTKEISNRLFDSHWKSKKLERKKKQAGKKSNEVERNLSRKLQKEVLLLVRS